MWEVRWNKSVLSTEIHCKGQELVISRALQEEKKKPLGDGVKLDQRPQQRSCGARCEERCP